MDVTSDHSKLILNVLALLLRLRDVVGDILEVLSSIVKHLLSSCFVLLLQNFVISDLLLKISNMIFETICLRIEHVDVVVQGVVLLLSLDKSSYNLINIRHSTVGLNLIESLLDNLSIANILINKSFLLAVNSSDSAHLNLQDLNWICEIITSSVIFICHLHSIVIYFLNVVLLFQSLLELFDLMFKFLFLAFSFTLQRKNLIVDFSSNSKVCYRLIRVLGYVCFKIFNSVLHFLSGSFRKGDFLSHNIDLNLELIVGTHCIVILPFRMLKSVQQILLVNYFFMFIFCRRNNLKDFSLQLRQFSLALLILIIDNEISFFLVL